jgi:Cu(I)/Ag(I) efflux system membrane fusion protein
VTDRDQLSNERRRTRVVSAALAGVVIVAGIVFRHPLIAWFTGASPGGSTGGSTPGASSTTAPGSGAPGVRPPGGSAERGSGGGRGSDIAYYTCSMHPAVHSETPGKCPICSMTLTPVTKDEQGAGVIHIDEARRAMLGIRTTRVVLAAIDLAITAKGRLVVDETRLHEITLKVGGYVSDLRINATGQSVHRGDMLFTLYSPELYAAQQEYLIARSNREALHDTARGDVLVQASETKLRLWGLADDQLRAISERGQPIERIPFRSPAAGVVIEKNVIDGAAVTAGARLFKIADLDQIWVEADVYEADLPRIKKDLPATITLTYLPGEVFAGKVAFIYPYLDPASRTGRVRIALANKTLQLKPDMFATVTFKVPLGPRLMVPSEAVVYTGPRRLVFLDLGKGALRPQEVTIGTMTGDNVEIVTGLKEGDVVVSSGNFLVAAESRVRSASGFWGDGDANH